MGISDQFHFGWWKDALESKMAYIQQNLPDRPQVVGLGEHAPNPVVMHVLNDTPFDYFMCDGFPADADITPCDINDLGSIISTGQADLVSIFRCSYFVKEKTKFLDQLRNLVKPGGYVFIDFLVGSSELPVLDFRYGDTYSAFSSGKSLALFESTFCEQQLIQRFYNEYSKFCAHARNWPLKTRWAYFSAFPSRYWRDSQHLKELTTDNFCETVRKLNQEKNVFSFADFERFGFEMVEFSSKYFYPETGKHNLYNLIVARLLG